MDNGFRIEVDPKYDQPQSHSQCMQGETGATGYASGCGKHYCCDNRSNNLQTRMTTRTKKICGGTHSCGGLHWCACTSTHLPGGTAEGGSGYGLGKVA